MGACITRNYFEENCLKSNPFCIEGSIHVNRLMISNAMKNIQGILGHINPNSSLCWEIYCFFVQIPAGRRGLLNNAHLSSSLSGFPH